MHERADQVVESHHTGERIIFRQTAADSGGQLLRADLVFSPGGAVGGEHVHPLQEERFEVARGSVRIRVAGEERLASIGDVVVVPPGVAHLLSNPGDAEAQVAVEFRPALNSETFFANVFAVMNARGIRPTPRMLLEFGAVLAHYRREFQFASLPVRLLVAVAGRLGRLAGHRPRYPVDVMQRADARLQASDGR
jgi:quercetin dioxygenase-like cupin family protein